MLKAQFKLRDAALLSTILILLTVSLKNSVAGVLLTFSLIVFYFIYKNYKLSEAVFLIYPIKFALTGIYIGNVYILLFLEAFVVAGLIHAAIKLNVTKYIIKVEYALIAIMFFFALLTDTIDLFRYNLTLLEYIASVRVSSVPLLLLFVMGAYLEERPWRLPVVSSALITGLVVSSSIAIANYFLFFYEGSGIQAYAPYLQYMGDEAFKDGRYILGEYFPRLNLLYGGATGSVAGIQALFALLILLGNMNNFSKGLSIGLILISSLLTISYSLIAACLILALFYIYFGKRFFIASVMFILMLFYITGVELHSNVSLFNYIENLLGLLIDNFSHLITFDIFFIGTINYVPSTLFTNNSYLSGPIDSGILRGFLDYGIFYFLSNILFFIVLFIKTFKVKQRGLKIIALSFFILILLLIHGNTMLRIPVTLMLIVMIGYVNMAINAEKKC